MWITFKNVWGFLLNRISLPVKILKLFMVMPCKPTLILADEKTAAALFCMQRAEFRKLVDAGALPQPIDLHGFARWRYSELEAVATGTAIEEEFEP
ncbi:hypothetical protein [Roseovarius sp. Pro17]|uniref:hypothetical protein n=1 Tax=Roseovarius sp. Pro17 TaxID=3108175 RepID=UPI002D780D52|nr:hypothetical protein [Roseovarius sp. Pro17]